MKKFFEAQGNKVVYILLSRITKRFIIAYGNKNTLRETYRHHIKLRREFSQNFIESISPERPCLFILEALAPGEKANLVLVWLRILLDNGFISCNSPNLIKKAESLDHHSTIAYFKRMHSDISDVLSCKNCYVPKYNHETCANYLEAPSEEVKNRLASISQVSRKRNKEIRICVTQQEYDCIHQRAADEKMTASHYIRRVAQNPVIKRYDRQAVSDHTKELAEIRNTLNNLVYTIHLSNNYLPREIDTIVSLMTEVFKTENKLLETLRNEQA